MHLNVQKWQEYFIAVFAIRLLRRQVRKCWSIEETQKISISLALFTFLIKREQVFVRIQIEIRQYFHSFLIHKFSFHVHLHVYKHFENTYSLNEYRLSWEA